MHAESVGVFTRPRSSASISPYLCKSAYPLIATRKRTLRDVRKVPIGDTVAYSITSSAVAISDWGTVRPSILAVWWLTTSSNLVDCTTGKSPGLAPLSRRPV